MNPIITIDASGLGIAALLVLALAALAWRWQLGFTNGLLIAAARTAIQLLLVGWVLQAVFDNASFWWVSLILLLMLVAAAREVGARQQHRIRGWFGYGIGAVAMFASSFSVALLALLVIIQPAPWYQPQYAIPLTGMLLGNTMTGVALTLDALHESVFHDRDVIEQRLMLGERATDAIADLRREALRRGMLPMINAMAAAGIISLPGMMTGQILSGTAPAEAVKYQIMIMLLIAAGTGFGAVVAVKLAERRLFDERERLRLDRLI